LAARVGVHFYGGVYAGRTELVRDVFGKVGWFWDQPLLNALNLFALAPTRTLAIAIALVAAVGIVLLHLDKGWEALGFLALAAVLVPLSYAPNLVVAENFASYRSLGSLSALLMLYLWFGLWGIARAVPRLRGRTVLVAGGVAMAAFALTGVVLAARNVTTLFAKPQSLELEMMRSALHTSSPIRRVVFVKPFVGEGAAPLVRYDEFGVPSSYLPWVPVPAVRLILREQRRQRSMPVIDVLAWDAPNIPRTTRPGEVLVDMRKLRERRIGWRVWSS
jgi:hypothetical protein